MGEESNYGWWSWQEKCRQRLFFQFGGRWKLQWILLVGERRIE